MTASRHIKPEYYTFFETYPLMYRHNDGDEAAIRNIAATIKLDEKRHNHDIIKRADRKLAGFRKLEHRLRANDISLYQAEQLRHIGETAVRIKRNILEHYTIIRGRGRNDFEKSHVQKEEDELVLLLAEGAYISHALTESVKKHYKNKLDNHRHKLRSGRYRDS